MPSRSHSKPPSGSSLVNSKLGSTLLSRAGGEAAGGEAAGGEAAGTAGDDAAGGTAGSAAGSAGEDAGRPGSGGSAGIGGASGSGGATGGEGGAGAPITPPPSCAPAETGASGAVQAPVLRATLSGSWDENWFASPALVDVDGDGALDIVAPRHSVLYVYRGDGTPLWQTAWASSASSSPEHGTVRMWLSAAVGDLDGDGDTEIAVSAHPDDAGYNVAVYDHEGELLPGWPRAFGDAEVRSLAAADVDGDGAAEILITKQADGPATAVFELDGSLA
ncbi:MAG: VCBS repeat-containing protein, partial [Polyangiaceae bacterium]|nr:VCBS repeat-containing protein [Polyangiaceae bacterium]